MAQSSEIKLLKRFDQNVEITGTLTVGGNSVLTSVPSEYLTQTEGDARYLQSFDITTQTDSKYLRSDASDSTSGALTIGGGSVKINGDATNIAKLSLNESTAEEHVILEYDGTGSGATNYFHIYSGVSGWSTKGTSFNIQPSTGDVNIGATNFGYKFRVEGTTYITSDTTIGGMLTINGSDGVSRLHINGTTPTINLDDSNGDSFYIHVNSNNFYILTDRDGTGDYNTWEEPHPLKLEADTNYGEIFGNEIIHAGNIGSQSVNYAASSGYATSSGTVSGTQLGATVHGLTAFTTPTDWSKPAGYQTMVRNSTSTGQPGGQDYFGYTITSRRDAGGGYSALLTGYANNDFWITYNGSSSNYPTWRRIWTDANDGSGSGLDADLLDGLHSSNFFRNGDNTLQMANNDGFVYDDGANVMKVKYDGTEYPIWTSANDGSGSGLDADLLDGSQGSYYDHRRYTDSNNYLGGYYVSGGTEKPNSSVFGAGKLKIAMLRGGSNNLGFGGTWNDVLWMSTYSGSDVKRSTALVSSKYDNTSVWIAKQSYDATEWGAGYLIWNSGNDGSGSGLDADLLDGQHGSFYTTANNITSGTLPADRLPWNSNDNFTGIYPLVWKAGTVPYTASWLNVNGSTDTLHTRNIDFSGHRLLRDSNSASDTVNIKAASSGQYFRVMTGQSGFGVADSEWTHTLHLSNLGPSNGNRAEIYHNSTKDIYIGNTTYKSPVKMFHSLSMGIPGNGSNVNGRFISIEGNADGSGEGSGRIFFAEHNSTTGAMDAYGMSIGYRGGGTTITGASGNSWTGLSQISNGSWGMWGHDADATGSLIMYGDRAATFVDFAGNNIQGITDIFVADQIIHTGDTDTYIQFHNADQFRVVIAGGEVTEWGNNYMKMRDNDQIRMGEGSDFGMWHDGNNHFFRNYHHASGNIYWQGENTSGTNQALIYMYCNSTRTHVRLYENSGERLRTTSAGVTVYGSLTATADVVAYSDIRTKENIKPITNALDKVKEIQGVEFNKIGDTNKSIGVIAQEIEKVLPEVVREQNDGMKAVAYGNITAILIEAVKELSNKVKEQQKQIDELKSLINK